MRTLRTLLVIAALTAILVGVPSASTGSLPSAAMTADSSGGAVASASPAGSAGDTTGEAGIVAEVLADLQAKYPDLEGVTVAFGETPRGEEAIAYYTEGRIVINRAHIVNIDKILAHEVWHVIDWRDNGRIDWGENLPPSSSSDYFRGSLPFGRDSSRTTGPAG